MGRAPDPPPSGPARAGAGQRRGAGDRTPRWLVALSLLFVAGLAALVASSLARPTPPTFAPTAPAASPPGGPAASPPDGPAGEGAAAAVRDTHTVDARSHEEWVYFDFSRPGVVAAPAPDGWDLAFRRFHIVVNGGEAFPGRGGARDLGDIPLDSLAAGAGARAAVGGRARPRPADPGPYRGTEGEPGGQPRHPVLEDWYRYGFFTHLLTPRPRTFDIRTADGGRAAIRILSYYCPGAEPGCPTFEFLHPLEP